MYAFYVGFCTYASASKKKYLTSNLAKEGGPP
jgi:hypothetical protein